MSHFFSNKRRISKIIGKNLVRLILLCYSAIVIYPVIWNLLTAFKTNKEILTSPWALPHGFEVDNFIRAFMKAKMGEYAMNSFSIVILSMVTMLILVVPAAYSLARFNFRFAGIIKNTYVVCLFIQANLIIVPLFLMMNSLHLTDNRVALGFLLAVLSIPFNTFLLISFMKTISREYEYAAMIDGCSYFAILMKVIVPMCKPAIVTVCMLSFFSYFNEYILTLTMISTDSKKTLPVGLANLFEVQRYATDWGALFAALIIVLIPSIVIYAFGQKTLTQGMSMGGLKG